MLRHLLELKSKIMFNTSQLNLFMNSIGKQVVEN